MKELRDMIEIKGEYNTAKIYTDELEEESYKQILMLCNQESLKDSNIRIMPDVHAGKGCVIGTTMLVKNNVIPNLVGVDIGCGMETIRILEKKSDIDFPAFDYQVKRSIPSGRFIRKFPHELILEKINLEDMRCYSELLNSKSKKRALNSIGTLGGGNHFIELDEDENNNIYLVVHSGSRNIGLQVANYYQNKAVSILRETKSDLTYDERNLAYLTGQLMEDYLYDMHIMQEYAKLNRKIIILEILKQMKWTVEDQFTTVHNFIDMEKMILRKGSIPAYKSDKVLIPINMRDGSLICIGKGNEEWNYSAPHGAGRIMSRKTARENISIEEFKESMKDVYSSTISKDTIDEAPMAYKNINDIIKYIEPTVEIINRLKPIYNFKAKD